MVCTVVFKKAQQISDKPNTFNGQIKESYNVDNSIDIKQ